MMPKKAAMTGTMNGIMMILSPAKTLDMSPWVQPSQSKLTPTEPDCDTAKTLEVARALKARTTSQLGKLLGISDKLAATASDYWKEFRENQQESDQRKPAVYAFSGAAYQGIQVKDCSAEGVAYMHDNLRIIDPLYGSLRALDLIQPYRLEMATRSVFPDEKSIKMAAFWSEAVTGRLATELKDRTTPILLNLASDEYSAAVDGDALPGNVQFIKVVFREEGRVIAVHAKRARGLMVRYVAEKQLTSVEDVKGFNEEGYAFEESQSDETTLVFDRRKNGKRTTKQPPVTKSKSKRSRR